MTKAQRKKIERGLFAYNLNLDISRNFAVNYALNSIDYSTPKVKTSAYNWAEDRIVRAISEEETAYKWCLVFEKTAERFRWTQKDELMRRRYIRHEGAIKTCMGIGIERRTYYYWLDEIIHVAFLWASEYHII